MKMSVARSLVIILTVVTISGIISPANAECGSALPKGSVICNIWRKVLNEFWFQWCTHGEMIVDLNCERETCQITPVAEIDAVRKWWPQNIPLGIIIDISNSYENVFEFEAARRNTIAEIVQFMEQRHLSFVHFNERSWERSFRNTTDRNSLAFMEELHSSFKARGWHIGLSVQLGSSTFLGILDWLKVVNYIDWFNLPAHRNDDRDNHFIPHRAPLALYKDNRGTTKYWIEHLLERVNPECIALELSSEGYKYTAKEAAVEPGPGSSAVGVHDWVRFTYKEACTRLAYDSNCRESWDDIAKSDWMICGEEFYSYESPRSIKYKVDLALSYNVTKVVSWAVPADDDDGSCGRGTFPNLRAMQAVREAGS